MPGKFEESPEARRRRQSQMTASEKIKQYMPLILIVAALLVVAILLGVLLNSCGDHSGTPGREPTHEEIEPVETTYPATDPEPTEPETTIPDTTSPETTVPETDPPETTAPPSTDPPATDPPATNPPATNPPATNPPVVDPNFDFTDGAVDPSWYDDVLFIGDSRVVGLRDYARSGNAEYFCSVGMSVFNYKTRTESDKNFPTQTLESLLSSRSYGKVFISLGINECGYPVSSFISAYSDLVNMVKQYQPNAKIILQGIMAVSRGYAGSLSYFQPGNIQAFNDRIGQLADGISTYYIDVNTVFTDDAGFLLPELSGDGCHLSGKYAAVWAQWISYSVGHLGL